MTSTEAELSFGINGPGDYGRTPFPLRIEDVKADIQNESQKFCKTYM